MIDRKGMVRYVDEGEGATPRRIRRSGSFLSKAARGFAHSYLLRLRLYVDPA
jgi:hypothetical protein